MQTELPPLDALMVAALERIPKHRVIGIGCGRTVDALIERLIQSRFPLEACVCASKFGADKFAKHGFEVRAINEVDEIVVYLDSADEVTVEGRCIKGGGGAMVREKILADLAQRFVCLVHAAKLKPMLGNFALPVEVIPDAASVVARRLRALGGEPRLRTGFVSENQGHILDVYNLDMTDTAKLERLLDQTPGVIGHGLFDRHRANILLVQQADESVTTIHTNTL